MYNPHRIWGKQIMFAALIFSVDIVNLTLTNLTLTLGFWKILTE